MNELNNSQIDFAINCFSKYLRFISRLPDGEANTTLLRVASNVEHSGLLLRLLEGKEPLEVAPPKSYSQPDYRLAEGKVTVGEMVEVQGKVSVNQSLTWVRDPDQKDVLIHESGMKIRFWENDEPSNTFYKYKFQRI